MTNGILWPTIAMAALVWTIWAAMGLARAGHLKRNPPRREDFADHEAALRYFTPVERPANNYRNLFELPVLYFALVPLLILTGLATDVQVGLAWGFVLLRVLHSIVHVVLGDVRRRALVFGASSIVLFAMWIGFAADLVRVGG